MAKRFFDEGRSDVADRQNDSVDRLNGFDGRQKTTTIGHVATTIEEGVSPIGPASKLIVIFTKPTVAEAKTIGEARQPVGFVMSSIVGDARSIGFGDDYLPPGLLLMHS